MNLSGKSGEKKSVRVLGIDPGSTITGYGIIDSNGARSVYVAHGHIKVKGDTFADRLGHIYTALTEVVDEWHPEQAAIEQVFLSVNPMSALKLGQARGAAITAIVTQSIGVSEYAARSIKQVVTGSGASSKEQVQIMVKSLLGLNRDVQADAADGLAIAICHAHSGFHTPNGQPAPRRRQRGRGLRM